MALPATSGFKRYMEKFLMKMVSDIEEKTPDAATRRPRPEPPQPTMRSNVPGLVLVPSSMVAYAEAALRASPDLVDQYVSRELRSALDSCGHAPKDPPDTSWLELEDVRNAHPWAKKRNPVSPVDRSWVKRQQIGEKPN